MSKATTVRPWKQVIFAIIALAAPQAGSAAAWLIDALPQEEAQASTANALAETIDPPSKSDAFVGDGHMAMPGAAGREDIYNRQHSTSAMPRPLASSFRVLGLDVSSHQGPINWTYVKNTANKGFALIRASAGKNTSDSYFAANAANAVAAGLVIGTYHFSYPQYFTAHDEAQKFLSVASSYIAHGYLPPVLDIEDSPIEGSYPYQLGAPVLSQWIRDWCAEVQQRTGIQPMIYTTRWYASNYLQSDLAQYLYWVPTNAGFADSDPGNLGIWSSWVFQQYLFGESGGTCAGVTGNVDLDSFNGDTNALLALANGSSPATVAVMLPRGLDLISFPFTPIGPGGTSTFADVLSGVSSDLFPYVFYLNSDNSIGYALASQVYIEPKRGYFVYMSADRQINVAGQTSTPTISIHKGINAIGVTAPTTLINPYVLDTAFTIQSTSVGLTSLSSTPLQPGIGYLIYSSANTTALSETGDVSATSFTQPRTTKTPITNSVGPFAGTIYVNQSSSGSAPAQLTLTFGLRSDATDSYDSGIDVLSDLPLPGSLNAFFDDGGFPLKTNYKSLADSKTWPFTVFSQSRGPSDTSDNFNPVVLSWTVPSSGAIDAGARVELLDGVGNVIVADMRSITSTSFPSTGSSTRKDYAIRSTASSNQDTTAPSVTITSPTTAPTYSTSTSPIVLAGSASDNVGVTQVTCTNTATSATMTATGTVSWSCSVALVSGINPITVRAYDAANNQGSASINVTYTTSDSVPPSVTITSPTMSSTFRTGTSSVSVGGVASDNVGVTQVTCSNLSTATTIEATGTTSWSCVLSLAIGSNTLRATARDAAGNSTNSSLVVTYVPLVFSDDPVVINGTPIKAAHIVELRTAINALRSAASLGPYSFTDSNLDGQLVKAMHIQELRTALSQSLSGLGLSQITYTYSPSAGAVIHGADINEIRSAVKNSANGLPASIDFHWNVASTLPEAIGRSAAATYNDEIYIFGAATFTRTYKYRPLTSQWTMLTDSPHGTSNGGAAAVGAKIYLVGAPADNAVQIYDIASNSWSTGAAIPTPRGYVATASANGKLYVIGGQLNSSATGIIEEYDPTTNAWTRKTDMPTGRYGASAATVKGVIYVIGGAGDGGILTHTVEAFYPNSNLWTRREDAPWFQGNSNLTPPYLATAAVLNDKIYVIGGYDNYVGSDLRQIEEFDPAKTDSTSYIPNAWSLKTPLSYARREAVSGVVNGNIYVFGGDASALNWNFSTPPMTVEVGVPYSP